MRSQHVLILWTLQLSLVISQAQNLPSCATRCITGNRQGDCSTPNSSTCLCQSRSYISTLQNCWCQSCSFDDAQSALSTLETVCSGPGIVLPQAPCGDIWGQATSTGSRQSLFPSTANSEPSSPITISTTLASTTATSISTTAATSTTIGSSSLVSTTSTSVRTTSSTTTTTTSSSGAASSASPTPSTNGSNLLTSPLHFIKRLDLISMLILVTTPFLL